MSYHGRLEYTLILKVFVFNKGISPNQLVDAPDQSGIDSYANAD